MRNGYILSDDDCYNDKYDDDVKDNDKKKSFSSFSSSELFFRTFKLRPESMDRNGYENSSRAIR